MISLSLLVGTGAATPSTAAAQSSCPVPLLVQCRDPAYLATTCGQASAASDTSACSVLLKNAYQTEITRPDVQVMQVMTPGQPGSTRVAAVKPYSFGTHIARNFTGELLGFDQKSQLLNVSGGSVNVFTDGLTRIGVASLKTQRLAWEANGNTVTSCAEYANERYRGYTKWKDLADVDLLSDEVLYDKAFDPALGIANRTLFSKSGVKALPGVTWPSNGIIGTLVIGGKPRNIIDPKSAKNGYFKAYHSLAKGTFFGPGDSALRTKLMSGSSHHIVDWNWHAAQHDLLAPSYDAETLRYYDDKQVDFLRLVTDRETVVNLIAKYGATMVITVDPPTTRNLQGELTALDTAIRSQLLAAEAEGCLDTVNPTKCDWSFRQLRSQVVASYAKSMEASYQTCIANTGDAFGPGAAIHNAGQMFAPYNNGVQDFATSAENIEAYGEVVKSWVAAQTFPKKADGTPFLGDRKADSGTIGSGSIALDWAYDTGWEIQNQANATLTKGSADCASTLSVDGSFSATGHAFGADMKIIDSKARLFTQASTGKAQVKLVVLEATVWNRWDNPYSTELQAGLVKEMKSGTSKSYSTTVYPFGIPVTLSGGVGMSVGLKLDAKAKGGLACATSPAGQTLELASIAGTVTPWAQADAFGSAAIGIPGFKAGVKCNVVIVRGEMPITANAKLTIDPARQVKASASLSGKQVFHMLDGNVKAFLDSPIDLLDTETTIFSWQGPKIDQEVFRFEKTDMPVGLMINGLQPAGT